MGIFFIVFGLVTLLIITLSNFVLPGRFFGMGFSLLLGTLPSILTLCIGIAIARLKIQTQGTRAIRFLEVAGVISGCAAAAMSIAILEPGVDFRHDRTTGPSKIYHNVVKPTGVFGTGVCRCAPDSQAIISLPGGFETLAFIYDNGDPGPRPGVVVAHGNTWMGGSLSTYRLLSRRLAQEGYIVLTFDFPGFGRSDDPFGQGPSSVAAAYDRTGQVDAAVDHLIKTTEVDRSNITVFGHSAGVDWAMRTGAGNPNVSKVAVMIAPPPPAEVENFAEKRVDYFTGRTAEQYRFVYGRKQPEWYRWELTGIDERYGDSVWAPYTKRGHIPILLILGERDKPRGHKSVLGEFERVVDPKRFVLLDRADHYLNTAQSLGLVFYDVAVARGLTNAMVFWIESSN
jgi:pimeloyl-ACP methyl ester carboxylesterase